MLHATICFAENQENHKAQVPYGWIFGSLGFGLALIILLAVIFISLRSSCSFAETRRSSGQDLDEKIPHKFQILRNTSFCCASGRNICCKSRDWKQTNGESSDHQINIPKGLCWDTTRESKCIYFKYDLKLTYTFYSKSLPLIIELRFHTQVSNLIE